MRDELHAEVKLEFVQISRAESIERIKSRGKQLVSRVFKFPLTISTCIFQFRYYQGYIFLETLNVQQLDEEANLYSRETTNVTIEYDVGRSKCRITRNECDAKL